MMNFILLKQFRYLAVEALLLESTAFRPGWTFN